MPAGSSKNYSSTQEERLFAKLQANSKNLGQSPALASQAKLRRPFREPFPEPQGDQWPPGVDFYRFCLCLQSFLKNSPLCCHLCACLGRENSYTFLFLIEWALRNILTFPLSDPHEFNRADNTSLETLHSLFILQTAFIFSALAPPPYLKDFYHHFLIVFVSVFQSSAEGFTYQISFTVWQHCKVGV